MDKVVHRLGGTGIEAVSTICSCAVNQQLLSTTVEDCVWLAIISHPGPKSRTVSRCLAVMIAPDDRDILRRVRRFSGLTSEHRTSGNISGSRRQIFLSGFAFISYTGLRSANQQHFSSAATHFRSHLIRLNYYSLHLHQDPHSL
jgi:hypothetical protein